MSMLNPEAPDFFPEWFTRTEDFSPEWWTLVKSNSSFRDYWIRERFDDLQEDEEENEEDDYIVDEPPPSWLSACLKEQDVNQVVKPRFVKKSDLTSLSKIQQQQPRFVAPLKFPQIPSKRAACIKNGSAAAHRIQQPR